MDSASDSSLRSTPTVLPVFFLGACGNDLESVDTDEERSDCVCGGLIGDVSGSESVIMPEDRSDGGLNGFFAGLVTALVAAAAVFFHAGLLFPGFVTLPPIVV